MKLVAPSILSADFANLQSEIEKVTEAGADWIHVDVMDGAFVPNLTIGPPVLASIDKITKIPLDVHLMIERPERYIETFVKAGSDYLTIHVEATSQVESTLKMIKQLGVKPGISLRPKTSIESLLPFLNRVDLVLVMTVEPGFGGQSFMEDQINKISWLKKKREELGLDYLIQVDGGINALTAKMAHEADVFVAGSFIFNHDVKQAIHTLKQITERNSL